MTDRVRRIKATHDAALLALPNVTGCFTGEKTIRGKGTGQIAIVVCVDHKRDVPAGDRIPPDIDGVPTDVIEEVVLPASDTTRYAPLAGGASLSAVAAPQTPGTLGCLVRTTDTSELMALSAYHVLAEWTTWTPGGNVVQPAMADGGVDGGDAIGTVQRASFGGNVDCAICTVSGRSAQGRVLQIGDLAGSAAAVVNSTVRKRGRTTGLSSGLVAATDYSVSISYSSLGGDLGGRGYVNQIRVTGASVGVGDSGAAIVDAQNRVVGLLIGYSGSSTIIANPIADVLSALSVAVEVPATPTAVSQARVYQQAVEVLRTAPNPGARAYQQAVEVLWTAPPPPPTAKPRSFAVLVG